VIVSQDVPVANWCHSWNISRWRHFTTSPRWRCVNSHLVCSKNKREWHWKQASAAEETVNYGDLSYHHS